MIEEENSNSLTGVYDKLSIQVSLNGLSFCVLDTISNSIRYSDKITFEKERSPFGMQKGLVTLFEKHSLGDKKFSEVVVLHRNNLFSLVPMSLFDVNEMPNYLKFNTKILATDHIDYDTLERFDMVNVYVPFANVNNYIYDHFGAFTFKHNGTVMVESLLNGSLNEAAPICYVHLADQQMDVTIISKKKLLFYNSFQFTTKEDFIYYLLFTLEQLKLDTEHTKLKLFGSIEEGDEIYTMAYAYVKNVSIFIPPAAAYPFIDINKDTIDFTILNSL
ncbi:MAG: DUF3822 family protein [Flavobacteriaceae bacterium]